MSFEDKAHGCPCIQYKQRIICLCLPTVAGQNFHDACLIAQLRTSNVGKILLTCSARHWCWHPENHSEFKSELSEQTRLQVCI